MKILSDQKCFDGRQLVVEHESTATKTSMRFALYLPPLAKQGPAPVLWWLSGLTCTEQNFTTKAGAQIHAARHGLILVVPDTSPRGADIPGEDDAGDFGTGAGFYVDAVVEPWSRHYRMYDYVVNELPTLVAANFPADTDRMGIFGHSMGGHGALVCALRNPDQYRSLSAFAPICNPMRCPWGQKAFRGYLGEQTELWRDYDATELIATRGWNRPLVIDQGDADPFLQEGQLLPDNLRAACDKAGVALDLQMRPGYDHSYFFIATFIGRHIEHHARALSS